MKKRSIIAQSIACGFLCTATDIYWNGALTYYYIKNMGLSIKNASIVMVLFAIFNAFDNLIAGSISDRCQSKLGRRLPFIRVCGPLLGLLFCLAHFPFALSHSQFFISVSYLLILCLLDSSVAFLEVCLYSLPYEETIDTAERGKVFICQAIFMFSSILISLVLIPEIQVDSTEDASSYRMIMWIVGLVCGIGIFICSFFIDSTYKNTSQESNGISMLKYIIECFKNKAFLISEIYSVASTMVYTIFVFGMYYYFDEVCTNQIPCYISAFLGVGIGLFVYFKWIKTKSVRFLAVTSSLTTTLFLLIGFLIGGNVGGAFACFGCGVQYVGHMMYSSLMFGESVDQDEVNTGLRREGTYNGIDCILSSITNSAQSLFLAICLAFGYQEGIATGTQTLQAQHGIMVAWLIPCIVSMIIASIAMKFYPLNEAKVKKNQQILIARRKAME